MCKAFNIYLLQICSHPKEISICICSIYVDVFYFISRDNNDWWKGVHNGKEGLIPASFVHAQSELWIEGVALFDFKVNLFHPLSNLEPNSSNLKDFFLQLIEF